MNVEQTLKNLLGGKAKDAAARTQIEILQKQVRQRQIPFSLAGALSVSTSTPWVVDSGWLSILSVVVLLGTAGTSNTVVTVYVNGSSVGTVTLGSGVTSNSAAFSTQLVQDTDVVTVGVTTVGTGAADLTVLLRVA